MQELTGNQCEQIMYCTKYVLPFSLLVLVCEC